MKIFPLSPVKTIKKGINVVGDLSDKATTYKKLLELDPDIQNLAKKKSITIGQNGDLLLINSGAKTSYINLKNVEYPGTVKDLIEANVCENSRLNRIGRRIKSTV